MYQKISRAAMYIALIIGIALSGLFSTSPVSAVVWNCSTGFSSVGVWGKCPSGDTTIYRVNILCQNIITRQAYSKPGNWVSRNTSTPSTIQGCGFLEGFFGQPSISTP